MNKRNINLSFRDSVTSMDRHVRHSEHIYIQRGRGRLSLWFQGSHNVVVGYWTIVMPSRESIPKKALIAKAILADKVLYSMTLTTNYENCLTSLRYVSASVKYCLPASDVQSCCPVYVTITVISFKNSKKARDWDCFPLLCLVLS